MSNRIFSILCGLAVAVSVSSASAQVPLAPADAGSILVRFRADADPVLAMTKAQLGGVARTALSLVPGLYRVDVPAGTTQAAIGALLADPGVMYAEPNFIYFAEGTQPTPPGVTMVNAPMAWGQTLGAGVRVAVLDTGVDFGHPDLPLPVASASFIAGETAQDGNRHGTHVSGTILGLDNTIGVVGVAPSAQLLIAKVLANSGGGSTDGIIQGMGWAVSNQARVINMSLGGGGFSQAFSDACDAALTGGCLVVASAGNSGTSTPNFPASYTGAMSVSAVGFNSSLASFSSFGTTVAITAPGVGILSTVPSSLALVSTVEWASVTRSSSVLTGSGSGSLSAQTVWCGTGGLPSDFPASVSGNIAAIRRGGTDESGATLSFRTKALNAQAAGAVAVIIANNVGGGPVSNATLQGSVALPVASVSLADGDTLEAGPVQASVGVGTAVNPNPYGSLSGTSMSAPHVSGVATLLFSAYADRNPPPTPAQVRQALQESATDLGALGRDDQFGFGLVNASAALTRLGQILCTSQPPSFVAVNIITHPATATVCPGGTATFSITASGTTPAYQWQWQPAGPGTAWAALSNGINLSGQGTPTFNVAGATTPTMNISSISGQGGNFRCIVSNTCGSVTSNEATLTVSAGGPSDIAGPGPTIGPDGELTADDIIFFISSFTAGNLGVADIAGPGPSVGADGELTADDVILFVQRLTAGC